MKIFKIYLDRLKDGQVEKINEQTSSAFIDVNEKELSFKEMVSVKGEAYIVDDHLILNLTIQTTASLPCNICNQIFDQPILIKNFYFSKACSEFSDPFFSYEGEVREAILLKVPQFVECNQGRCPERASIDKYLKKEEPKKGEGLKISTHFPFSDLENL